MKLNEPESKNLFELIHKRCRKHPLSFCSQFRAEYQHERLGVNDTPLADDIMDCIVYYSYKINIESMAPFKDHSMREVYEIDKNQIR